MPTAMEARPDDAGHQAPEMSEVAEPRQQGRKAALRRRYEGSFAQEFFRGLGAVDFGDRIILFGAAMLLSVLPLVIVLSAYANHHVEDDLARHLGLSTKGEHVVEGLFRASVKSFNLAIFVSLLLAFAGTVAVARSVELIYERAFDLPPLARGQSWLRCVVWVVVVAGVMIADGAIDNALRADAGVVAFGAVEFVLFTAFFWWSTHFLLGGRESWRGVLPAGIATGLFWIGLGVFAGFYFSTTIVDDSKTYGTIGVAFTLATWFISIGAVLTLGAVAGAVWQRRRSRSRKPATA